MDKVHDNLYIGSWQDAAQHRVGLLLQNKITAVVNLAIDHDDEWPAFPNAFYFKVGLIDGGGNKQHHLDAAVWLVEHLMDNGETVLVHCISGMSRSAYVGTRVIANRTGMSHQEVYDDMKVARPRVSMCHTFKELLGVE
jgi:protein-tyrosine phosphatase